MGPAPALHTYRPDLAHKPARKALHDLDDGRVVAIGGVVAADDDLDVAIGLGSERGEVVLERDEAPSLSAHDHAEEGRGGALGRRRHRAPGGGQLGRGDG